MTTMAALLGALPLMLSTGVGAELRQPLEFVWLVAYEPNPHLIYHTGYLLIVRPSFSLF